LDWTLDAFDRVMEMEVYFVGGYRLDEIVQAYPNIIFSVNPNWESQGTLGSLLAAPLASDLTTYICYSDIVITADIVKLLQDAAGDVVLVADRDWRHRYEARSTEDMASAEKLKIVDGRVTEIDLDIPVEQTDAEFVGIMKLSPRAVSQLITFRERQQELAANGMPRLIQEFLAAGLDVTPAEIEAAGPSSTLPRTWPVSSWGQKQIPWNVCGPWFGKVSSVSRSNLLCRNGRMTNTGCWLRSAINLGTTP